MNVYAGSPTNFDVLVGLPVFKGRTVFRKYSANY